MTPNRRSSWRTGWRGLGLAVAVFAFLSLSAWAQDLRPDQGGADAKQAERKAEEPKAPDRAVTAERAERDAQELRDNVDQPPKKLAKDKRWIEVKRELRKAQEALDDLRADGKDAEADEVERRVRKLEAKLESLERAPEGDRGDEPEWGGPRPPGDGPERPPKVAELERRLRHLQVAVENLHAAGMHDVADKLAGEAERMRREFDADARAGLRGPMPPGPEVKQLRADVEELRGLIQDLQERVEALSRKER